MSQKLALLLTVLGLGAVLAVFLVEAVGGSEPVATYITGVHEDGYFVASVGCSKIWVSQEECDVFAEETCTANGLDFNKLSGTPNLFTRTFNYECVVPGKENG